MTGFSLSLLLVVALLGRAALDDPYVASTPDQTPSVVVPAQAASVLHALEEAVATGDVAAAERVATPGDEAARSALVSLVENARALRVEDFTLRYVDELGAPSGDGGWAAAVDATWSFRGFDRAPARAEVRFRFVTDGAEVFVDSVGGGDRRSPVWMTGPAQVRRTPQSLVVVAGSDSAADAYARLARRAVPAVRQVLPRWSARLVVEVPGSVDALHRALDAEPGEYANIAAVTTTADGGLGPDAPVHVFVNPAVFDDLGRRGAQVVVTHEAVHVATDAATSVMPLWLLEGFADYVALREVDLPLSVTAGQIIGRVRRDGPPEELPGPVEFDTTTSHLGAAYESAWLACRLLVDLGGQASLVRFYRRVEGGAGVGRALRDEFGLTERELTRRWQRLLTDLAA